MSDVNDIINNLASITESMDIDQEFQTAANEYISIFTDYLDMYYINPDEDVAQEGSLVSSKEHPVLVVLTTGDNPLSNLIKKATGDAFTHSSISFNTDLNPMYSFGEKNGGTSKISGKERSSLGFVRTYPTDELWHTDKEKVPYSIYGTLVSFDVYNKMKNRLDFFLRNQFDLRYSFKQLINVKLNIKSHSQAKWFCSRFVADILNAGNKLPKDPSLYRPQSFVDMSGMHYLASGDSIEKYDKRPVEEGLKDLSYNMKQDLIG